ncbi:pantoate--beta-alanine ligase [Quadrisphaera oryzae]|uniref:pantoate--beta-alanine ligase n=1 Tax=Quadrisphaera TaxID=317661 RepID=UPI0016470412|nr:pantoate--beta-alanine ligase [Quadrisphaera sp. RL12-1S]
MTTTPAPGGSAPAPRPSVPLLVRTRAELSQARAALSGRVAVVMTMGALHAGHASLVAAARERADAVVVTIFLNPLQFEAGADLARYPRTLDADLALLGGVGADVVFAPSPDVVYPDGDPAVRVSSGRLGGVLEGASRPGHFDGVLTVVAKLMHLVRPDVALFGQKDAQQLLLVRRMVRDLDLAVEVVAVPTVRDDDGLALSSRNAHLSPLDREVALVLSRALRAGEAAAPEGASAVRRAARDVLVGEPLARVDYLALVDPDTLDDVPEHFRGPALLAVAAKVGPTRLIDNLPLVVGRWSAPPADRTSARPAAAQGSR